MDILDRNVPSYVTVNAQVVTLLTVSVIGDAIQDGREATVKNVNMLF